jgi:hypothetical protein
MFGMVISTILMPFLFPKGVMDGERPLKIKRTVQNLPSENYIPQQFEFSF